MKGISHEAHIAPSELKIEVEMPYPRFAPGVIHMSPFQGSMTPSEQEIESHF
jgi:hypothetical protein